MGQSRIAVDTDPGIDDAVALALVCTLAGERLIGISTTYGNCSGEWAAANTAAIVSLCGVSKVPIAPGALGPLCRVHQPALETHSNDGLGYARSCHPGLCPTERLPATKHWGPDALIEWARSARDCGGLTLVCLGPLTNLSLAIARAKETLLDCIKSVVIMGGSASAAGNTTPVSEFNFWSDPEAARAVFLSGLPLSMVGLDVTRRMVMSADAVNKLRKAADHTPYPGLIRVLTAAMRYYIEFHQSVEGLNGCILNDPLAVLLALQPQLGVSRALHVSIECGDGSTRGQSVCDWYGFMGQQPNAHVYVDIDGTQAMHKVWEPLAPGILAATDLML